MLTKSHSSARGALRTCIELYITCQQFDTLIEDADRRYYTRLQLQQRRVQSERSNENSRVNFTDLIKTNLQANVAILLNS